MRKGFFASVAALTAGAGMALAQGGPGGPPPGAMPGPAWAASGGPAPNAPPAGGSDGFYGAPGVQPADAGPVPPAPEMPLNGMVPGPNCEHPMNPGCAPPTTHYPGQIHKAAGGPDRWWFNVEENIWTIRSMPVATPLLTIGPAAGGGLIGADNTIVGLGDQNLERHQYLSALRVSGGLWDKCRNWGVEFSGFITEDKPQVYEQPVFTTSNVILARPVTFTTDNVTFQPNAFVIGGTGLFNGEFRSSTSFHMGGAEGNLLRNLIYCDMIKANFLLGVRYVDMSENLSIESSSILPNANNPLFPITSQVFDSFNTHNQFSGGQVGIETELRCGRWFSDLTGKFMMGNMHERLQINGLTDTTINGISNPQTGGLLALPTNIGAFSLNKYAYLGEGTATVGYQWTQRISTYVGGNYMYVDRVLRPGPQIDPVVNPTYIPTTNGQFGPPSGVPRPVPTFHQSDFWIGGVTIGLTVRY
jgi:hypothetical protein